MKIIVATIAAFLKSFTSFAAPSGVDAILGDFLAAKAKLEALIVHHETRAEALQDQMDELRSQQFASDTIADRAATMAARLNTFLAA